MKKNKIALLLAVVVMWTNSFTCLAATKTAAGLENNTPSGTSDAQAFVEGIKKYDSAYSKTYKDPSSVTASDFWSKSHTIKYWSSHGSNNGTVWGANSSVSVNIFDQPFSWAGGELEFVFLAACRQLDGSGRNPRSRYANAMVGNKAVRTICGYHESAPAKRQMQKSIANADKLNMDTVVESVTPIVMAEVNLNGEAEKETTIAYDVLLQNTYDGYEIIGNYMSGIIDDSSLIYLAGNWSEMEKVPMKLISTTVDFDSAYNRVMEKATAQIVSTGTSVSKQVTNSKLAFVLNDATGYYEPTWVFDMGDGSVCHVNCLSGELDSLD